MLPKNKTEYADNKSIQRRRVSGQRVMELKKYMMY